MQHQLGASEGSISLQRDEEELLGSRDPGEPARRQEARWPVQEPRGTGECWLFTGRVAVYKCPLSDL